MEETNAKLGSVTTGDSDGLLVLTVGGRWNIGGAEKLESSLGAVTPRPGQSVRLDLEPLESIDTAVALVLRRTMKRLESKGHSTELVGARPAHAAFIDLVATNDRPTVCHPPKENPITAVVERVGRGTYGTLREVRNVIGFLGMTLMAIARCIVNPRRIRWTSLINHIEHSGLNALPIVGLLSFLIGIVMAYQGADQLRRFGSEIFVVNLIGISMLRELGTLLTAILVAGRSGSAYTAQIGSMTAHEEVDAMRTLGLSPMEVLVVPRVIALVVALPILAFFASMVGLLGGGIMAWVELGIRPALFIDRLSSALTMSTFIVGMVKAPVFAFIIAMVGCYEGFRVTGSAESVGRLTTLSVVESIFLVIAADAIFSVFFAYLGV